ncbi:MAG: pyruvate formate lyase family protein [Desulfitobacterium sp.]
MIIKNLGSEESSMGTVETLNNSDCFLTPQEKRLESGAGLSSPRLRTNKFLESYNNQVPRIDVQRAVLFTESMKETEAYPLEIRWAKAVAYVMENIEVVIQDSELIVGTCGGPGRYCILYPELRAGWFEKGLPDTQKKDAYTISDEAIKEVMDKVVPYWKGKTAHEHYLSILPKETREIIYGDDDYGATGLMQDNSNISSTLNWVGEYKRIISEGLNSIIKEAEDKLAAIKSNLKCNHYDSIPFLESVIIICKGLITYAKRYANKARELAAIEKDPQRKSELEVIAANCEWVPANSARNFHEAVQAQWFVQVAYRFEQAINGGVGLGRFDQYMYPTYIADIQSGAIDENGALEFLECLWFKIADNVPFNATNANNYWEGYAHFEDITIGGQNRAGKDITNELTYLILRSKKEFPFHYPEIAVRLHSGSPERLLRSAAELVKEGVGFPKFFNDEEIIPMLQNNGASLEDARDYAQSGCTEIRMSTVDTYLPLGGNINLASALEMAMNNGFVTYGANHRQLMVPSIKADSIMAFEDVFQNLEEAVDYFVQHYYKRQTALELTNKARLAAPFTSAVHPICMNAMKDIHQPNIGGVYKDCGNCNFNGFGTCAESLAAIKKLVFEEKRFTLEELKAALKANFEGYEPIRQMLLNAPKYGNNDEYADEIARNLDEMLLRTVKKYTTPYGERYCKFVPVTSHVGMGGKVGATPNGRRAGESLSEGISPSQGVDKEGPLATLISIDNAKSRVHSNSLARLLNIKLTPQTVVGEKGTKDLIRLIRSFVDLKLWHIQFAVVNRETLLKAQKDPEKYRNLIVRVAGYSAYFTELSPGLQNEIISRTEHQIV